MAEHYCQRIPDLSPTSLHIGAEDDPAVCGKIAHFSIQFKDLFAKESWEHWNDPEDDKTYHLCAECYDFVQIWNQPQ